MAWNKQDHVRLSSKGWILVDWITEVLVDALTPVSTQDAMSSNDRDPTDSLDSLFADALKAMDKTKKESERTPSYSTEKDDPQDSRF